MQHRRIGVVTTSYPRWPGDAAGGFVAGHVEYLRGTGAEVEVVAIGDPDADADDVADDEARGIARIGGRGLVYRGGASEALERGWRGAPGALAVSARLTATVARRARGWDAVVAHWLAPSALAAALAAGGRPLLAIAHGGDVHLLARTRMLGPALALLHARGATIAFVAEALRQRALATLPPARAAALRTLVQPMGVDDRATAAIRAVRAARPPDAFTVERPAMLLVLARLVPIKSIATAIAALRHVVTPVRLIVAGDGPERRALAEAAAPLGPRVRLLGQVDTPTRDRLLATADALLVPSIARPHGREEGTPLAALEALAAGVRVIASATGGLVDLAAHGAVLVPPADPPALAAAIDRALAGPAPPPAEVGWSVAGLALDRAWGRVPGYAPGTSTTQGAHASRSDRPAGG